MKLLFLQILLATSTISYGQFHFLGDARPMDKNCIVLTPDMPYREGIAYSTTRLNFDQDFQIEFDIFLGEKNEDGADGITFVIHNDARAFNAFGTFGECMGYGRWVADVPYGTFIAPSIAVEFDTYYNPNQNDPVCDHVAYLENGSSAHQTYYNAEDQSYNLEDGYLHSFIFIWNATTKNLKVRLDSELVFETTKDLKKEIFNGSAKVIWGFTASTGRAHNLQYFCVKRMAYLPEKNLEGTKILTAEINYPGAEPRGIQRNILLHEKPDAFQTFPHITPR